MSGREPSFTLAVDANILVIAVLGRVGPRVLRQAATSRLLLTTPRAHREARRVLADSRLGRPVGDAAIEATLAIVSVHPGELFEDSLGDAGLCLSDAVASANGSISDAHLLALAWATGADIWSHDRDFAGTGWPSWSTRNLRRALAPDQG